MTFNHISGTCLVLTGMCFFVRYAWLKPDPRAWPPISRLTWAIIYLSGAIFVFMGVKIFQGVDMKTPSMTVVSATLLIYKLAILLNEMAQRGMIHKRKCALTALSERGWFIASAHERKPEVL